jgi:uncharacterized protein YndB with AHSA1/START domain
MPTTVTKRLTIAAPIEKVWAALTSAKTISAWMGGPVKVSARVGGRYALFSGETTGRFVLVEKPAALEYTWRQSSWEKEWEDSIVRWELKAARDGTRIKLTHTRFPSTEERDGHAEGWDLYWLAPMKKWLEGKD